MRSINGGWVAYKLAHAKHFNIKKSKLFLFLFTSYICISCSCCNICLINIMCMFSADIPACFDTCKCVSFCSEMARSRKRVRLSLVIDINGLEGKNVFKRRLDNVKKARQSDLDNYGLTSAIFDSVMNKCSTAIKVVIYYYQPCKWDNTRLLPRANYYKNKLFITLLNMLCIRTYIHIYIYIYIYIYCL